MTTKTIIFQLPVAGDREAGDPNFAYLAVNNTFEKTIENHRRILKENNLRSVSLDGKGFLELVVDDKKVIATALSF